MNARFWEYDTAPAEGGNSHARGVRCTLCFRACRLLPGKAGYCGARFNAAAPEGKEHTLISPYLSRFTSVAVDPIEKKPLYHWRPGSAILSLGSLGCNMRCPFCQNHRIAQPAKGAVLPPLRGATPAETLAALRKHALTAVAYTYNEPLLQAEYILTAAPLLREAGAATVLVTNGMFSEQALTELRPWIDAANVDVKTFNADTYARLGGSLETVKQTVAGLLAAGTHVELTTLVVPGVSDSEDEFAAEVDWIASLSPDIPLHISRYFPHHAYTAPATDIALMQRFALHAKDSLRKVHLGNMPRPI